MYRRPFYEVPEDAYLFGRRKTPEEEVRQWVLFELLSTYGFHIRDIEIEKTMIAGTKNVFADIVINKRKTPYIVIECKQREVNFKEKDFGQLKSYANLSGTEFAVWTNSKTWRVNRKINSEWTFFTDIPRFVNTPAVVDDLGELHAGNMMSFVKTSAPLLAWPLERVKQDQARSYLESLLEFLVSSKPWISFIDTRFRGGVTDILKACIHFGRDEEYASMKFQKACKCFVLYFKDIEFDNSISKKIDMKASEQPNLEFFRVDNEALADGSIGRASNMRVLIDDLKFLDERTSWTNDSERLLLRVAMMLLEYLEEAVYQFGHSDLPITTVQETNIFLESLYRKYFGVNLPRSFEDNEEFRQSLMALLLPENNAADADASSHNTSTVPVTFGRLRRLFNAAFRS